MYWAQGKQYWVLQPGENGSFLGEAHCQVAASLRSTFSLLEEVLQRNSECIRNHDQRSYGTGYGAEFRVVLRLNAQDFRRLPRRKPRGAFSSTRKPVLFSSLMKPGDRTNHEA